MTKTLIGTPDPEPSGRVTFQVYQGAGNQMIDFPSATTWTTTVSFVEGIGHANHPPSSRPRELFDANTIEGEVVDDDEAG